jgi:hypothetical protein
MKLVIRTLFFHFLNILIFSIIYYSISIDFEFSPEHIPTFFDYILFATTIQAGVGITQLYPSTAFGKLMIILQQWIMLCTHVITLYIFTI